MNPYRHVLAVTDFSELSRSAVRRALLEARMHGARCGLLHVVEHFPVAVPDQWVAPENIDPATYYRGRSAQELGRLVAELDAPAAAQDVLVTDSSAGHAIAEFARQRNVDLIVAGIHGSWAIGMLGSTAAAIVRQAPCDVLLVR